MFTLWSPLHDPEHLIIKRFKPDSLVSWQPEKLTVTFIGDNAIFNNYYPMSIQVGVSTELKKPKKPTAPNRAARFGAVWDENRFGSVPHFVKIGKPNRTEYYKFVNIRGVSIKYTLSLNWTCPPCELIISFSCTKIETEIELKFLARYGSVAVPNPTRCSFKIFYRNRADWCLPPYSSQNRFLESYVPRSALPMIMQILSLGGTFTQ